MTKSTITREQLRALAVKKIESLKFAITQSAFTNIRRGLEDELQLAKFALAAMDSEPVAWLWSRDGDDERDVSLTSPDDDDDAADAIECGWTATPLYRHAQQPVVPDDVSIFEAAIEECKKCDSIDEHAWNHGVLAVIAEYESCRAAMLNGGKS